MDPDGEDEMMDEDVDSEQKEEIITVIPVDDDDSVPRPTVTLQTSTVTSYTPKDDHYDFVCKLAASFEYQHDSGFIKWPRQFNTHQKSLMPIKRIERIKRRRKNKEKK
jgi:hypothetical protein